MADTLDYMVNEVNALLAFNKQLHDVIEGKLRNENTNIASEKDFFVAFIIGKAFKTYESIGVLCQKGYGEDAFVLARSLFEMMITVAYILQDQTDERLARYVSYDWVTRKNMYDYIQTNDDILAVLNEEVAHTSSESTIVEVEAEYKKAMNKYKYNNGRWSDKSIRDMSEAVGRLDAYKTVYGLQCIIGHTNVRSVNTYIQHTEEEFVFNLGESWDNVRVTLAVSFDFFFHLAKEADKQLSWGLESVLEDLAKEYADSMSESHNS